MGIGGFRLFNWLDRRNEAGPSGQVFAEAMSTRAVIAGPTSWPAVGRVIITTAYPSSSSSSNWYAC
jgi:hypothetical protein